jgi:hypothetical protein
MVPGDPSLWSRARSSTLQSILPAQPVRIASTRTVGVTDDRAACACPGHGAEWYYGLRQRLVAHDCAPVEPPCGIPSGPARAHRTLSHPRFPTLFGASSVDPWGRPSPDELREIEAWDSICRAVDMEMAVGVRPRISRTAHALHMRVGRRGRRPPTESMVRASLGPMSVWIAPLRSRAHIQLRLLALATRSPTAA